MATTPKKPKKTSNPIIICDATGTAVETKHKADGSLKLPSGWKRLGGKVYCKEGLEKSYTLRCLKFPVASVVACFRSETEAETAFNLRSRPKDKDHRATLKSGLVVANDHKSWTEQRSATGKHLFHSCLDVSLEQCRRIRNHVLFRLAGLDTKPLIITNIKGKKKTTLPKMPDINKTLYTELRRMYPDVDSQSMGDVLRKSVQAYHKKNRWDVRVTGRKSLETARRAVLPLMAKDSEIYFEPGDAGRPIVKVRMGCEGTTGIRFLLRLGLGKGFRQYRGFLEGVANESLIRGTAILRKKKDGQVMFHLPVWIPKRAEGADGVLLLSTHAEHLLVAEVQNEHFGPEWRENEDQLRRWSAELRWWKERHKRLLLRFGDDRKKEKRLDRKTRRQMQRVLDARCEKQSMRVADRLRKVAASVADYARRRKCFNVVYDDSVRTYLDIPWADLKRFIAEALDALGIGLVCRGDNEEQSDERGE